MATFNKFQPFVAALAHGVHDFSSDSLKVALTNASNPPSAANAVLADLTQIAYTNLSSRDLTIDSSGQSGGTYKLVLDDLVLTASGGSVAAFRYVVLYNDTATGDPLIGWYDYGANLTLANGETLTLDFDGVDGVLQIA